MESINDLIKKIQNTTVRPTYTVQEKEVMLDLYVTRALKVMKLFKEVSEKYSSNMEYNNTLFTYIVELFLLHAHFKKVWGIKLKNFSDFVNLVHMYKNTLPLHFYGLDE